MRQTSLQVTSHEEKGSLFVASLNWRCRVAERKKVGMQEFVARTGFSLVLGGGGSTGVAYCCGVLQALHDEAGLDPTAADVIIGTSAGAVVAADLALGRSIDEVMETVSDTAAPSADRAHRRAWQSTPDLMRRMVGSAWIMSRSSLPVAVRTPEPPALLQRMFPGSLLDVDSGGWTERYPSEWPEQVVWTVASDLETGKRVVLRADGESLRATLRQAVEASCAVPGVFRPVRVDGRRLVDGGVHSVTNLDLAVHTGSRVVIALAPMGFEPDQPPGRVRAAGRNRFNSRLHQEAKRVGRSGAKVLLMRPTGAELAHHGYNILSRSGNDKVRIAAYEATCRRLTEPTAAGMLAETNVTSKES